jgi:NAD(P)-dependent dehydrogenase (short-subunit alcohol dehydrogenase family)
MTVRHSGTRLAGKRILIVGGGAQEIPGEAEPPVGIGQAMAVRAVAEGATIVLADIDPVASQRTIDLIGSAAGMATAIQADVRSVDDCRRIISSAIDVFGEIDGIAINVGVTARGGGQASRASLLTTGTGCSKSTYGEVSSCARPHSHKESQTMRQ